MSEETKPELSAAAMAREEKKYKKTVRRKVVIEEEVSDKPDPYSYEPVTFRFYNEQQRGVPVFYEWIDKWIKMNECKGYFYDGGIYTLPRIVYEYYKTRCGEPIRADVEMELFPGQTGKKSKEIGFKPHY